MVGSAAAAPRGSRRPPAPSRAVQLAGLDQRYEVGARLLAHGQPAIGLVDGGRIGAGRHRPHRGDHADVPGTRGGRGGHRSGAHDAQHRHRRRGPNVAEGVRGGGVAGQDQRLDVLGEQPRDAFEGEAPDLVCRSWAVRACARYHPGRRSIRPGRRRWISDRTVRPPTPESKTPIGRVGGTGHRVRQRATRERGRARAGARWARRRCS